MLRPAEYYEGKTILLTGATGFVGKVVLETLLRRLPDVARIHVLIRPRSLPGGTPISPWDTLQKEVLATTAFAALRARHGAGFEAFVGSRVDTVAGDIGRPALGLAEPARSRLADEVDLIIHCAALAVFNAPLDQALRTNALGPSNVLEFARSGNSAPFVAHVSTCYVSNLPGPVFERPPIPDATDATDPAAKFDIDAELQALEERVAALGRADGDGTGTDAQRGERWRARMIAEGMNWARRRGWKDTYTFTKALGEQVFERRRGDVRGLILRPSIIESPLRHPAPGWIDGYRMVDPLIVGFARGQIFEFPGHHDSVLDIIPVDRVVNALLMAIPYADRDNGPTVYQVASGMDNPLRVAELRDHMAEHFRQVPLRRSPGSGEPKPLPELSFPPVEPFLRSLERRKLRPLRLLMALYEPFRSTTWGRHRYATLAGYRGRLQRLRDMAAIYGPYAASHVRFLTYNTRSLWDRMSPEEREAFPLVVEGMDWKHYLQAIHVPGIKRYLLRMKDVEPATDPGPVDRVRQDVAANPRGPAAPSQRVESAPIDEPLLDDEPVAYGGKTRWHKAEQLLAATRSVEPATARGWIRPGRRFGLRSMTMRLNGLIARNFLGLTVHGREQLPGRGPFILVSNHCSHVDTGVLLAALGDRAGRVHPTAAADYWFSSRLIGWLLHGTLAAVPFDRHATGVPRALALPAEVLRQGDSLIFYPEGTRSPDGEMRAFKSTVGLLALASGAPVVPAHVSGTMDVLPKGSLWPRWARVRVRFGAPVRVDGYFRRLDHESVAAVARSLAHDVHRAVEQLATADDVVRSAVEDAGRIL